MTIKKINNLLIWPAFVGCLLLTVAAMEKKPIEVLKNHNDIGNPKIKGSTTFDTKTGTYTLTGGGYNIWFNRDELQFAWKKIKGDFILTGEFEFVGKGTEGHRKTGWMVRTSLADTAVHISAVAHGDGLTVLQWRLEPGMNMRDPEDEIRAPGINYGIVQLQRTGNKFIMRVAKTATSPLIVVGEKEMKNMQDEVLAGLFICSHNAAVAEQVKVKNVKITY